MVDGELEALMESVCVCRKKKTNEEGWKDVCGVSEGIQLHAYAALALARSHGSFYRRGNNRISSFE